MSVPVAYIGVILIWSTTPLAIKWSGEGAGFLFGVGSRMVLGAGLALVIMALLRRALPWHGQALRTYLAAGAGFYGAMMCVYWGAQFIPSGLVSVIFGTTPVVTGLMAAIWLKEQSFTPARVFGVLLGLSGLAVIFGVGGDGHGHALWGVAGVLCSVHMHSFSMVTVKRINAPLHPLAVTTGALCVAAPLYVLTWLLFDGSIPQSLPARSGAAIVYLGIVGSVLGSMLFFYALRHVQASKMGLIPLITPVLALTVGALVNDEPIAASTVLGTTLILAGLVFYEFSSLLFRRRGKLVSAGTSREPQAAPVAAESE